jgi:hypothetical protein
MTKRDAQAREYAAESYAKTPAKRGVSDTFDLLSDATEFLLEMATRRVARTHYEGCRKDHVECLVAALVDAVTRLRDSTPTTHATPAKGSVQAGCALTNEERAAINCFAAGEWTSLRWSEVEKHCVTLRSLLDRRQHAVNDWRLEAGVQRERAAAAEAEVARLREAIRLIADQYATLTVQGGNVIVTMDATLNDDERAAIEWYAHFPDGIHAATLRNLLERTK